MNESCLTCAMLCIERHCLAVAWGLERVGVCVFACRARTRRQLKIHKQTNKQTIIVSKFNSIVIYSTYCLDNTLSS